MTIAEKVASLGLALAGSLALAGACTPADVTGPSEQACQDFAYAYCQAVQACSSTYIAINYGNAATCEVLEKQLCVDALTAPSTGATLAQRRACTDAISKGAWACNDFLTSQNPPTACQTAPGALPNGAPCAIREQCHSTYCADTPNQMCGTCADPPALGDPCPTGQCAQGDICALQTCQAHAGIGSICTNAITCDQGLNCAYPVGSSMGTCQVGVTMAQAPCTLASGGCSINDGLACNVASGVCEAIHLAAPGEACGLVGDQLTTCALGTCTRGVCLAKPTLGAPCEIGGTNCATPAACIASVDGGTTGTCRIRGTAVCD